MSTDRELVQLDGLDFFQLSDASELFLEQPPRVRVQNYDGAASDSQFIIINDGDVHMIAFGFQANWDTHLPAPMVVSDLIEGEVKVWPQLFRVQGYSNSAFNFAFYDTEGHRFVSLSGGAIFNKISPFPAPQYGAFDVNNIGADKEILHFGRGYNNIAYAVFATGDKRSFYTMNFNATPTQENVALGIKDMSALPEIRNAKFYDLGRLGDVFIYATERSIYTYDYIGSNNGARITDDFGPGERITAMKIFDPSSFPANVAELQQTTGRILYVATWDGTQGRLYEFGFNPSSGVLTDKTPLNVFDGLGRVSDMCMMICYPDAR